MKISAPPTLPSLSIQAVDSQKSLVSLNLVQEPVSKSRLPLFGLKPVVKVPQDYENITKDKQAEDLFGNFGGSKG